MTHVEEGCGTDETPCYCDDQSEESEEDVDRSLCYAEGVVKDYTGADLIENVWFAMKPPKHLGIENPPFISARKLEIARAQLTGSTNRDKDKKKETDPVPPSHSGYPEPISMCKRKSIVRFIRKPQNLGESKK